VSAQHTNTGLDELREWLIAHGFSIAPNYIGDGNGCNWYAYRRSALQSVECECNDGTAQIVVYPFAFSRYSQQWESVEAEVCGEAGGVWFRLRAYSMRPAEFCEKLESVEASLIAAWNALSR
jgi:hypothetical protein